MQLMSYTPSMLPRTYENQNCSIARTLEVVGERWTALILRDAVRGTRRFEDFQASLGIARNILSARLARLCEEGILERRRYQERPARDEYHLTAKGRDLEPVLLGLLRWGDRYAAPDGPPLCSPTPRAGTSSSRCWSAPTVSRL